MLILTGGGGKRIIPLQRYVHRAGVVLWRDALNGTKSGRIGCSDQIEKAYQEVINKIIVG